MSHKHHSDLFVDVPHALSLTLETLLSCVSCFIQTDLVINGTLMSSGKCTVKVGERHA